MGSPLAHSAGGTYLEQILLSGMVEEPVVAMLQEKLSVLFVKTQTSSTGGPEGEEAGDAVGMGVGAATGG